MNLHRKKRIVTYTLVTSIACLFIFLAVFRCAFLIKNNYRAQLMQNLFDVSNQYSETLRSQIDSRYDLLMSVTARFEEEGSNSPNILNIYKPVVKSFKLRRLGIIDKYGITYSTDEDTNGENLSYREFFKRSMNGEAYISDVLFDALSEDHESIMVMSTPVFDDDGKVSAVTFITYEAEIFSQQLAKKSFENYGENFVINHNGNVVISSNEDILPVTTCVFDTDFYLLDGEKDLKQQFISDMAGNIQHSGQLTFNNQNYFYQMTPCDVMDGHNAWFILSVVPETYLLARFHDVRRNLHRMVTIVVLIIIACAMGYRYFYRAQRRITYELAYCSPLTGGPNLDRFFEYVSSLKNKVGYIVFMNIEDFTHTSVATGVEKSNELIKAIWDIIVVRLNHGEYACHYKADSFVFYLKCKDDETIEKRITKFRDIVHDEGLKMNIPWVFAKFGVCKINPDDDVKAVYSRAEYTVFNSWGLKEFISFYSEEDHDRRSLDKAIEENFEEAIENERFEIWFQPKYSIGEEKLTGAEALVRWRKRDRTLLAPSLFIPLLEKNGDIAILDEYVYEHVCKKQSEWKAKGLKIVPVSINVSRATLYRDSIVEKYTDMLNEYDISTNDIQLEVTESIVGGSGNIQELLSKFRNSGIKILMDDFGTGYSSLSTLNLKCFDTLKIDKSLVDEIEDDYGRTLIYQTIEMGYALGLHITVEGVEKESQLEILRTMKCDDIQGFYFSKPLPVEEFEKTLAIGGML